MENRIYIGFFRIIFLLTPLSILFSCEPENSPENSPEIPEEETIEIRDPNFKYALLNTNCVDSDNDRTGNNDIDLNNDGKIQISELETVESLILEFDFHKIVRSVDLQEIKYFKNLEYLEVTNKMSEGFVENTNSDRIAYDFSNLKNLKSLQLNYLPTDFYSTINLEGLSNLKVLDLSQNRPSYLVIPEEWESPIHFTEIKMVGCTNLLELSMINSFLIIDFCQVPSLKRLDMQYLEGGEPDTFDFHCLTQLEWLDISENYFESLILKNTSVLHTFIARDIGSAGEYTNYPFLKYICIDNIEEEFQQISTLRNEETVVTTECSFQ